MIPIGSAFNDFPFLRGLANLRSEGRIPPFDHGDNLTPSARGCQMPWQCLGKYSFISPHLVALWGQPLPIRLVQCLSFLECFFLVRSW